MARFYLETLAFLPQGHMGGGMKLRHMLTTWPAVGVSLQDKVQTLSTVSRAIHKYYSMLLCYCGTSA